MTRPSRTERLLDAVADNKTVVARAGVPYLTRWTLFRLNLFGRKVRVAVHHFSRGDLDPDRHDHPWPFVSVILWGGYSEETAGGKLRRHGPGRVLVRKAGHAHRVVIAPGHTSWSLVFTGKKEREWGFHCPRGWVPWRAYVARTDSGGQGCAD